MIIWDTKKYFLILTFFACFFSLQAKPDAVITSERTYSDTVDFGMCLKNESTSHIFTITNTGDVPL